MDKEMAKRQGEDTFNGIFALFCMTCGRGEIPFGFGNGTAEIIRLLRLAPPAKYFVKLSE